MRSILNRLGRKQLVAAILVAAMTLTGGVALAQAGEDDPGGPSEATTQAITAQQLESRFVPVTPCRLVDTRKTSKLAADELRAFSAVGGDLSGQGGSGSGCDIPARAGAIAVNLTSVFPAGQGYLRVNATCSYFVFNSPCTNTVPNATVLNYSKALNASNGVEIPICSQWTASLFACSGGNFVAKAFTSATHLVVDVVGYYARPIFAIVDGDNSAPGDPANVTRSSGFGTMEHTATGNYLLNPADDIRGCAVTAAPTTSTDGQFPLAGGTVVAYVETDSDIVVETYDSSGTLTNGEFTIVVAC